MAVVRRPPQRPALRAGGADEADDEDGDLGVGRHLGFRLIVDGQLHVVLEGVIDVVAACGGCTLYRGIKFTWLQLLIEEQTPMQLSRRDQSSTCEPPPSTLISTYQSRQYTRCDN